MSILKKFVFWPMCALIAASALNAHAATVSYSLKDVLLADGAQMTGAFDWTYAPGDFEGGSGVFTALAIPYIPGGSAPPLEQEGMILTIENNQIEITLDGNFHDYGLNISLKFLTPLAATQSSIINLDTSFYECCGNGFKDQPFQSGSIAPVPIPGAAWLFAPALLGMGIAYRGRKLRQELTLVH